jgi:hypothetical protein
MVGMEITPTYVLSVGKSEGKKPLGKLRHKWECIKMDLKALGYEHVDLIHVA